MVQSIILRTGKNNYDCNFTNFQHKTTIVLPSLIQDTENAFDLIVTFKNGIKQFRNHDYSWADCKEDRIATTFAPKVLKLVDNCYVQPNINTGFWEVNKGETNRLIWRFNVKNASPLTEYIGEKNERKVIQASQKIASNSLDLLFSFNNAIEFSRSLIPFAAIVCFTDHCDFDTLQSLEIQRAFFKKNSIKITKGFFANHYSKREDNASYEKNATEFEQWKHDGHELAYHSLSQSIKPLQQSMEDFENWLPPSSDITTWIDHGYQPYNLSLYKNNDISDNEFAETLARKKITTLWNYIDAGTASSQVINQLNKNDFTLKRFLTATRGLALPYRASLIIKNIIFHYYGDEKTVLDYRQTATSIKNLLAQRKIKNVLPLIKNLIRLSIPLLKVFIFWNKHSNTPYRLAKYTPILFKHSISQKEFYIFQTLEMVDFKKALDPKNIVRLIAEKGLFIAHTYFSVPMSYHKGRMFESPTNISEEVELNFKNLGKKIRDKEIWNPTLNELVIFLNNFETTLLDVDEAGNITVLNTSGLPYRTVS